MFSCWATGSLHKSPDRPTIGISYFMAQRRMFSKKITNSSEFLMMSQGSQALYLHLSMNADDDGFCELFTIMRMTDSKPDDLKALHEKGFVYVFDGKVLVIKDWGENNYIRQDRYEKSKYLTDEQYSHIREAYETIKKPLAILLKEHGQPDGNQRLPQDRIGKDRIGKDREEREPTTLNMKDFIKNPRGSEKLINWLKEKYPETDVEAELEKFVAYWSEKDNDTQQQRWQGQQYFELTKRLPTWFELAKQYNKGEQKQDFVVLDFSKKNGSDKS